jgi:LacI family transcriptional regulator
MRANAARKKPSTTRPSVSRVAPAGERAAVVTLVELAKAANVSASTVSRALRDDPRLKHETRGRIRLLADSLGYRPNLAARNLVTGHTRTFWLVMSGVGYAPGYEPAEAASRFLHARGYDLHIVLHHGDPETLKRSLSRLFQHVADGALVVSCDVEGEKAGLSELVAAGFPIVFLDRHVPGVRSPAVSTDNFGAARELVLRGQRAGAREVLNLIEPADSVTSVRSRGVVETAQAKNMRLLTPESLGASAPGRRGSAPAPLLIVANAADVIQRFVRAHQRELFERKMVFACFDEWSGEPVPAERVFVCEQDFSAMAERASARLLELATGKSERPNLVTVPPKGFREITPSF